MLEVQKIADAVDPHAVSVALFALTTVAVVLVVTAVHRLRPGGDAGRA